MLVALAHCLSPLPIARCPRLLLLARHLSPVACRANDLVEKPIEDVSLVASANSISDQDWHT